MSFSSLECASAPPEPELDAGKARISVSATFKYERP